MKKIKIILFAVFASLMILVACKTAPKVETNNHLSDYLTEGWLDDNNFQVRTTGTPNQNSKGFYRRRNQAVEAAIVIAKKKIMERLIGSATASLTPEFKTILKEGKPVRKSYDENDVAQITFRITSKGLKGKTSAK